VNTGSGITSLKATLEIYRRKELLDVIMVMFNPPEYSTSKGAKYASTSILGMSTPISQFVSGEADTVSLELFMDTTLMADALPVDVDVRVFVKRLERLVLIDEELHAPPHCVFRWGTLAFKATVAKVDTTYTKFNPVGIPVRAKVRLTFTEYKTFDEIKVKSEKKSADLARVYVVGEGDSLWLIAHKKLGDPALWKYIAKENGIANPLDLTTGTELKIPRVEK
jgi:hypothetical protein